MKRKHNDRNFQLQEGKTEDKKIPSENRRAAKIRLCLAKGLKTSVVVQ